MSLQPKALYIAHGGGPMPLLNGGSGGSDGKGDPAHAEMISVLKSIASEIPKPDAIVLISAHWEANQATITSAKNPDLIYDYYGFPDEAYQITYPCAGHPTLANQIKQAFDNQGIQSVMDDNRGFDHGLYVPLKIMYPNADIPCVQVSLLNSLDPEAHLALGKALQGLHKQNVLVLGSGFSFHNMSAFFGDDSQRTRQLNSDFENWLKETCSDTTINEQERATRLKQWASAPGARFCHPREEHLLPLHVCYGVAQTPCTKRYELTVLNRQTSMYLW